MGAFESRQSISLDDRGGGESVAKQLWELQQVFSAAAPLCVISMNHEILMINDALCALLEISPDQLQDWKCHDIFHHDRCHTDACPLYRIQSQTERLQYEVTLETLSGQSLDLLATATPLFDDEGNSILGVVVSFMDMSEQKKTCEALAQANQELKDMQTHLVQNEKLSAIGQLAAGVAHEMNTPVGFVASNFETLWQYMHKLCTVIESQQKIIACIGDDANTEIKALVTEIQAQQRKLKLDFVLEDLPAVFAESREGIERVAEIVQNLRDFSRIDQAEDLDSFDLNEGVRSTLMVAKNHIEQVAQVELELGDIPLIYGHAGQLNQVFLNILMNAVQILAQHAGVEAGRIHIRTYLVEDSVVCEFTDNGPGIPEDHKAKIFDPFYTTQPVGKGTGLGLSIAHDIIVNKHKGSLSVTSELGQGSTFIIQLPRDLGLHV